MVRTLGGAAWAVVVGSNVLVQTGRLTIVAALAKHISNSPLCDSAKLPTDFVAPPAFGRKSHVVALLVPAVVPKEADNETASTSAIVGRSHTAATLCQPNDNTLNHCHGENKQRFATTTIHGRPFSLNEEGTPRVAPLSNSRSADGQHVWPCLLLLTEQSCSAPPHPSLPPPPPPSQSMVAQKCESGDISGGLF
uniref:Secreted protein n=1 Tax=Trichuris muris TaxID=70415 RepID=A0A5S6QA89_TRIMR